jgi:hypothetical protein
MVLRIEGGRGESEPGRDLVVGGEGAEVGGLAPDSEWVAAGGVDNQRTSGIVLVIIVLPLFCCLLIIVLLAYNRSVTNSGFSETLSAKREPIYTTFSLHTDGTFVLYGARGPSKLPYGPGGGISVVLGGSGCGLLNTVYLLGAPPGNP